MKHDMQNYFISGKKCRFLGKQSHTDLPKLCLKGVKGIEKSSMHRCLSSKCVRTQKVSIRLRTL
ncbi:MAG: hypothetical protein EKK63_15545 [Acinetobacter sp.]|nr:MAG: hypothetical protein EKK63_15545 [Acinetobacter sp.]